MRVALGILGALLAFAPLALDPQAQALRLASPWLALLTATVVASGTWMGLLLGGLALGLGSLTLEGPTLTPVSACALVAGGVALGILVREVETRSLWALTVGARRTGAWASALVACLCLLPDERLVLLDDQGAPLLLSARVQDPMAGIEGLVQIPAVIESSVPGASLLVIALAFALLAAFFLLKGLIDSQARPDSRASASNPWGWRALGLAAGLVALTGALGLVQLLEGSVVVPEPEAWALWLSRMGQGSAVSNLVLEGAPTLGLSSRPLVDPLRLIAGAGVCAWSLGPWRHGSSSRIQGPRPAILVAVAAASLATLLGLGPGGLSVMGSALLMFMGVLVAQRCPPSSRLSDELLTLATACSLLAWLSPAWSGGFG